MRHCLYIGRYTILVWFFFVLLHWLRRAGVTPNRAQYEKTRNLESEVDITKTWYPVTGIEIYLHILASRISRPFFMLVQEVPSLYSFQIRTRRSSKDQSCMPQTHLHSNGRNFGAIFIRVDITYLWSRLLFSRSSNSVDGWFFRVRVNASVG